MSDIFISYNRHSESIAKTLVDDIENLGHTVWFDQDLSGGQAWWSEILTRIRDCQVFVFLLDQKSLKSVACIREYNYANNLGKPILPIWVADKISINLLPPALSKIQSVDYRKQDRDSGLRLARAFNNVPPTRPLPDLLPPPPEVPISYLGGLAEEIDTTATLDINQQKILVASLKSSLHDSETTNDVRELLESMRKRRDIYASIAVEIDELLAIKPKASASPVRAPQVKQEKATQQRLAREKAQPEKIAQEKIAQVFDNLSPYIYTYIYNFIEIVVPFLILSALYFFFPDFFLFKIVRDALTAINN